MTANASSTAAAHVMGLVLAGGMGRRMESRDKGLVPFRSKPMVAHVIERFAPQVNELIINANRTIKTYAAFGYAVVSDEVSGFAGPLAGLHAGMRACRAAPAHASARERTWLATVPCDSPFLPLDLVQRLRDAATKENAEIAVAVSENFAQPVFALYQTSLLESLEAFLNAGERKIDKWTAMHSVANVVFDDARAFANINTIDELNAWK
jgi:molybdenum cofactor guanylyltransferase